MASCDGDRLTLWTANRTLNWGLRDLAETLGIPEANIRMHSPFIGGSFGGKGTILADAIMASLGARASGRPVKVALPRPLIRPNGWPVIEAFLGGEGARIIEEDGPAAGFSHVSAELASTVRQRRGVGDPTDGGDRLEPNGFYRRRI